MEPLQPTVRQGVAQLKDFITKLVDIQEKDGEPFRARPRPLPRPTQCLSLLHPQPDVEVCFAPGPALAARGSRFAFPPWPAELDLQRALSLQAPPVKEGPLFIHRTKGKGPLTSSSFKKLHFSLTTEALSFAKTPSSKVGEGTRG